MILKGQAAEKCGFQILLQMEVEKMGIKSQRPEWKESHGDGQLSRPNNAFGVAVKILGLKGSPERGNKSHYKIKS